MRASTIVLASCLAGGCATTHSRYDYKTASAATRGDTATAQRLNYDGLELIQQGNRQGATEKFRAALEADIYCAAAHNNLGLALIQDGQYYDAAWEFQYAAKLMPGATEPRNNLGLLYERLGKLKPAIDEYNAALKIDANDIETMRNLARAQVKTGNNNEETKELLQRILLTSDDPKWDYWIRGQLVRLGRPTESSIWDPEDSDD